MDFTFFPTKVDGGGGIFTHCSTFYIIINVLIMINLEDLTVKNITLLKIKFINHRNLGLPSPEKPLLEGRNMYYLELRTVYYYGTANSYAIYPCMPIS